MDLAATVRKVEELPSDGGKIVDTLAGAVLRVFARLGEFETEIGLRHHLGVHFGLTSPG